MPVRKITGGKGLRLTGSLLLLCTLLLFVWLTGGAVAAGWMLHADHYGTVFRGLATGYFICAVLMTAAVILHFCKADRIAAVLGAVSYLPMPLILRHAVNIAEQSGWVQNIDPKFYASAADAFRSGMRWTWIPALLLLILSLTRAFSAEAKQRRAAESERPAPSILADEAEIAPENPTGTDDPRQDSAETMKNRTGR